MWLIDRLRKSRSTIGSITHLFGALDNLLKTNDRDRICQVVEERLQFLFDIKHSCILFATVVAEAHQVYTSRSNSLHPHISKIPIPEATSTSIINTCFEKPGLGYISTHMDARKISRNDSKLMAFLGCDAILAIPAPITDKARGVLVDGLSQSKLLSLLDATEPLLHLALQTGARLQLEEKMRTEGSLTLPHGPYEDSDIPQLPRTMAKQQYSTSRKHL